MNRVPFGVGMSEAVILVGMCALNAIGEPTNTPQYLIAFKNGDRLHGRPEAAVASADRLSLTMLCAFSPLDVRLSSIARILREGGSDDHPEPAPLVHLTNGDVLPLQHAPRIQEDRLVCSTSYAGELKIARAMVSRIELGPRGAARQSVLVPLDLSRWAIPGRTGVDNEWFVENGRLTTGSTTPIGTDITNMSDAVSIQFEVAANAAPLAFAFEVGGLAALPQSKGKYVLGLSGDRIHLARSNLDGRTAQIAGGASMPGELQGRTALAFDLWIDRVRGRMVLYAEGLLVGRWTDPAPLGNTGGGLVLRPQTGARFCLTRLCIGSWNGMVPTDPNDFAVSAVDRVALTNGDIVSGSIESLGEDKVTVKGTYAAMVVPLDSLWWLQFGNAGSGSARRNKNDIRVRLPNGGRLTFDLISLDAGTVRGASENFGTADIVLDAIHAAEFDIYREPAPAPVPPPRERSNGYWSD